MYIHTYVYLYVWPCVNKLIDDVQMWCRRMPQKQPKVAGNRKSVGIWNLRRMRMALDEHTAITGKGQRSRHIQETKANRANCSRKEARKYQSQRAAWCCLCYCATPPTTLPLCTKLFQTLLDDILQFCPLYFTVAPNVTGINNRVFVFALFTISLAKFWSI